MEASSPHCKSSHLLDGSIAAMIAVLLLNILAFLIYDVSMGYCWSMILMLQWVYWIPLFNLYMPTCLSHYMKQIGLA